jgi:hypothetical protein
MILQTNCCVYKPCHILLEKLPGEAGRFIISGLNLLETFTTFALSLENLAKKWKSDRKRVFQAKVLTLKEEYF